MWRRISLPTFLRWAGYGGFFLTCFVFATYLCFPFDRLKTYLIQEVEYPRRPDGSREASGYRLEIDDLSSYWLSGIEADGVRISKLMAETGKYMPLANLTWAAVRVKLLPLLLARVSLSFSLEAGAGSITGSFARHGEDAFDVSAELDALDLRNLGIIGKAIGLPLVGTATGDFELELPIDPAQAAGHGTFTIAELKLGDGKSKLALPGMGDGLTIERLNAGTLTAKYEVLQGAVKITELAAKGPDINLQGKGNIRLAKPLNASDINVMLRVNILDTYRNRNERTQSLFTLMDFNPVLQNAKVPGGGLQFRITGTPAFGVSAIPSGTSPMPP